MLKQNLTHIKELLPTINLILDTIRLAMKKRKKSRCGVAAPQRQGLSIYFISN